MKVSSLFSRINYRFIARRGFFCSRGGVLRRHARSRMCRGPGFSSPGPARGGPLCERALPARTASAEIKGGEAQAFARDMDIPGEWWTLFHSKALNDLIGQALKSNPDLDAAQAALRGARENVYAQRGAYFPSVDANFNPTRQKIAKELTSPLASNSTIYSLHTAQVSVGYTIDLFGGNKRQVESLKAQADFQRFQLEAAYLTLTSNVVAGAVEEAALRGQIEATMRIVEVQANPSNFSAPIRSRPDSRAGRGGPGSGSRANRNDAAAFAKATGPAAGPARAPGGPLPE